MTRLLLALAVLCELVAALTAFDWLVHADYAGWLALGLAFGFAAFLAGSLPALSLTRGGK